MTSLKNSDLTTARMQSEAASKTSRPPGRPRVFTDAEFAAVAGERPHVTTRRGQADHLYARRALAAIGTDPAFDWLRDGRFSILAELGRMNDAQRIRDSAQVLCEQRPTVKHGAAMVRRARMGKAAPKGLRHLAGRVTALMNEYQQTHLTMRYRDWLTVLEGVRRAVKAAEASYRAGRDAACAAQG